MSVTVFAAVEGDLDEEVVRRLVQEVGAELGHVYGGRGKQYLRNRITNFNCAAENAGSLWFVLVDLDRDFVCASQLRQHWLPQPSTRLCLRVAVQAVEAWLMADRESFARFLSIPESRVPWNPDQVEDPKAKVLELARRAKKRFIREEMVPHPESGLRVGPGYTLYLREYVRKFWRPIVAAERSESLRRAIAALRGLIGERGGIAQTG